MKKQVRIAITAAVPIGAALLFLLRNVWIGLAEYFPPCFFHTVTGYLCPACGNTRCVLALLHGDIPAAVRNNVTPVLLLVLLLLLYAETALGLTGKQIRLLPRNGVFWGILMGMMFLYYILRNVFDILAPL